MGCDIHLQVEQRVNGAWSIVHDVPEGIDGRNYDLFGVLANVRNGTWGDALPPIAERRGLPPDHVRRFDDDEEDQFGDHSFSYVTLAELLAYEWDAPVRKVGYVTAAFAEAWDGVTPPDSYSAWSNTGREIRWTQKRSDGMHGWVETVVPWLQTLGAPDDVRLVFGFDS